MENAAKKPVIFISNFHPFTTRNIFDTGVLSGIAEGAEKVIVFVPQEKEEYMKRGYERGNILVHGINLDPLLFDKKTILFSRLAELLIHTRTKENHHLIYRAEGGSALKYYFSLFAMRTLGHVAWVKKFFRVLDDRLDNPRPFQKYFEKYRPQLAFATDIFDIRDTFFLKNAKSFGVRTVGLVRSWDNTNNKCLLRAVPDRILLQNEEMKRECLSYHAFPGEKISLTGVPQYEHYLRYKPISREEFCRQMGLDPKKRIILYSPAGKKYIDTDWQICEVLKELLEKRKIPQDVQFLIRLHPQNFTDMSRFAPHPNFVIDDPGVGFKSDRAKESEMSTATVNHLADTLYHSHLVINVISSIVIDAAIFDKPVLTIGFDGWEKEVPYHQSIERVQREEWLAELLETGVSPLAGDKEKLGALIREHLDCPEKLASVRKRFVGEHCWKFDGNSHKRVTTLVLGRYEEYQSLCR